MTGKTMALLACAVVLSACRGDELARVPLTGPGQTATTTWKTDGAASASVWIDYDGEWVGFENDPGLSYAVEVLDGATSVQTLTCATSSCSTHVCGNSIQMGNRNDSECECKTSCVATTPRAGTFTVRATVSNPGAGGSFVGKNASLVLRQ